MNYLELVKTYERLAILQALITVPNYTLNNILLRNSLDVYGHKIGFDAIRAHLDFLADRQLVKLEKPTDALWVAVLTMKGIDIAEGRATQDGIAKVTPETLGGA